MRQRGGRGCSPRRDHVDAARRHDRQRLVAAAARKRGVQGGNDGVGRRVAEQGDAGRGGEQAGKRRGRGGRSVGAAPPASTGASLSPSIPLLLPAAVPGQLLVERGGAERAPAGGSEDRAGRRGVERALMVGRGGDWMEEERRAAVAAGDGFAAVAAIATLRLTFSASASARSRSSPVQGARDAGRRSGGGGEAIGVPTPGPIERARPPPGRVALDREPASGAVGRAARAAPVASVGDGAGRQRSRRRPASPPLARAARPVASSGGVPDLERVGEAVPGARGNRPRSSATPGARRPTPAPRQAPLSPAAHLPLPALRHARHARPHPGAGGRRRVGRRCVGAARVGASGWRACGPRARAPPPAWLASSIGDVGGWRLRDAGWGRPRRGG